MSTHERREVGAGGRATRRGQMRGGEGSGARDVARPRRRATRLSQRSRWPLIVVRLSALAEDDDHEQWVLRLLEHLMLLESKKPLHKLKTPRQIHERAEFL